MTTSETPSLHQQADRLRDWRAGFQAVYVIATGVQTGFFDHLAAHPTWQVQQQMLTEAGFISIERHFVRQIPQGTHYLAVVHKR